MNLLSRVLSGYHLAHLNPHAGHAALRGDIPAGRSGVRQVADQLPAEA